MKNTRIALLTVSLMAAGQQVTTTGQTSASSNTSVSADRSGANIQSDNNANAATQTDVVAPERHRASRESQESQPNARHKDRHDGSAEAAGALTAGTTVNAVLAKPLDSSKCRPGDPIVATADRDVKSDGVVVIRKGSHLIGHITEASSRGKGEAKSSLGIVFDRAVLKDGQQVPMNSVVQALAAARATPVSAAGDESYGAVGGGSVASRTGGGGGLVGGAASTVGATAGSVASVGGGATSGVNSTLGSAVNAPGGLNGALSSTSSGVIGLGGLSLAGDAANTTQGTIITSPNKNVHLDSGTQMVLRVVNR